MMALAWWDGPTDGALHARLGTFDRFFSRGVLDGRITPARLQRSASVRVLVRKPRAPYSAAGIDHPFRLIVSASIGAPSATRSAGLQVRAGELALMRVEARV